MPFIDRQNILSKIETQRGGRTAVCLFNFDRQCNPPVPGIATQFQADIKEALFRVLKESTHTQQGLDLCLYTRGGDVNAVWPIVSLLREFDENFEVLVPFRCHSGGTLVALGSKKIVLTPLSELSPIDPTTGNQFNPSDPSNPSARLGISVEDVVAYRTFVLDQFKNDEHNPGDRGHSILPPFVQSLVEKVHPLALGNVHRVHLQIKQLAGNLLGLHPCQGRNVKEVTDALTTKFYSHLHMINREEARTILGGEHVAFAPPDLAMALDELLRAYEDDFALRKQFFLNEKLGDQPSNEVRFIGGVVESKSWSYVYETVAKVKQHSAIPPNVQVQLPPSQPMPLIEGLPREISVEVTRQGWIRNKEPKGVTK
jgi:hypothetical protein